MDMSIAILQSDFKESTCSAVCGLIIFSFLSNRPLDLFRVETHRAQTYISQSPLQKSISTWLILADVVLLECPSKKEVQEV
jgi:hypothetical protein